MRDLPNMPAAPRPDRAYLQKLAAAAHDLEDVLTGSGRHSGHQQRQYGRCVYCSCGARAQGRLARRGGTDPLRAVQQG